MDSGIVTLVVYYNICTTSVHFYDCTLNLKLCWFVVFSVLAVCDDTCREAVLDPTNELLVCTISGHCFDLLVSPAEMEPDTVRESPLVYSCFSQS